MVREQDIQEAVERFRSGFNGQNLEEAFLQATRGFTKADMITVWRVVANIPVNSFADHITGWAA